MDVGQLYGRSIAFPPHLGSDGRWAWSEGAENIRESIEVILLTEAGERLMLQTFGGGLRRFLFEPNTTATRRLMQERIEDALRLWEPRIRMQNVQVAVDPADSQQAIVTIQYKLVATQTSSRLTLTVNLGS